MKYSKYNIFSRIRDSENNFIVNLLSGNADILTPGDAEKIEAVKKSEIIQDTELLKELGEKGYLSDEHEESGLFRSKYLDFLDSREKDEIKIYFVTNNSCNFACNY